jgi:hypothetical protein
VWDELSAADDFRQADDNEIALATDFAAKADDLVQIAASAAQQGQLAGVSERDKRDLNERSAACSIRSARIN